MMTASVTSLYLALKSEDDRKASFPLHVWRAHDQIGSVLCCGSSLLESAATIAYHSILTASEKQDFVSKQATRLDTYRKQIPELLVRWSLFDKFEVVVGNELPAGVRRRLKDLLMDVVYPTPEPEMGGSC
jgi:hypothetical protein